MANFRELTKKEKKSFNFFIRGYVDGIYGVPSAVRAKPGFSTGPGDGDILDSYKEHVKFFKRSKKAYAEYRKGYFDGWFKCLSCETARQLMDPDLCEDVKEYLQSIWLHDIVYGAKETDSK